MNTAEQKMFGTSFGVFKYMALYSMIQFISVLILYTNRKALEVSLSTVYCNVIFSIFKIAKKGLLRKKDFALYERSCV